MRQFFRLNDNVHIPKRWHLDEILDAHGEYHDFLEGAPANPAQPLTTSISHGSKPLQFCLTSLANPVACELLTNAITFIAGPDLQSFPLRIKGHQGYHALNAIRTIDCLDESRSDFTKWTTDDHRSDLADEYRAVYQLRIDPGRIPPDTHFFRIWGWQIGLIVSAELRQIMEDVGCLGARFEDVVS